MIKSGSFFLRFIAAILDAFIGYTIAFIISKIGQSIGLSGNHIPEKVELGVASQSYFELFANAFTQHFSSLQFLAVILNLAIIAYFLRTKGATIGKLILGLKVIDIRSRPQLSYGQIFFRETIGKLLSSILMIGYLMALFTKNKRALHDFLAKTRVIKIED